MRECFLAPRAKQNVSVDFSQPRAELPIFFRPPGYLALGSILNMLVGLMFGRHDISMPRLPDTSRTVYTPNTDPLLPERAPCT